MDCKDVQERIIDYIEGDLDAKEQKLIEEHIEICSQCEKEFLELKATIEYIIDEANLINVENNIKLSPKITNKSFKKVTRTGLIAIALSFILVVTAFAAEVLGFFDYWKKSSEIPMNAWMQLIDNGVGQKLDISVTDGGIKVTAEGVISDEKNTIVLLKIEDLNGKERYVPDIFEEKYGDSISLSGDIAGMEYFTRGYPLWRRTPLYSEDENIVRLMVGTNPIEGNEGNIGIHINRLTRFYSPDIESIEDREIIHGNWDISIPVKQIQSKTYIVNKDIDLDGNKLTINKVIVAPTATVIDYTIDKFNRKNNYFIGNITFSIKYNSKIYERSELSTNLDGISYGYGVEDSTFHIESLYNEDPSNLEIILNSYNYKKIGFEIFDIDYDHLPQTIDYKSSQMVIEEVIKEDDSISLIIREDESKGREHYETDFYFSIIGPKTFMDKDKKIIIKHSYTSYSTYIEWETRDSKGRKVDLSKEDRWKDEFYQYAFKYKLTMNKDSLIRMGMDEKDIEHISPPGQLYAEGPYYIKFPNIKVNIKLK